VPSFGAAKTARRSTSPLAAVHPLHLAITSALVLCGAGALVGVVWPKSDLIGFSFFFGWWVTVSAMIIAVVLVIILLYRSLSGSARPLLAKSWLGLLNGAVALISWAVVIRSGIG
jgi:hypothetical protein